jgi:hypothetical protein
MTSRVLPALVLAVLLGGCADFATPAELAKPTVLAIVAEPPLVAPGEATRLSVILAGPDGPMVADRVDWSLAETFAGIPPFGTIEVAPGEPPGTATYTAPDPLPELPEGYLPITSVAVHVAAGDTEIDSIKALVVTDVPGANPAITVLAVGGAVVAPGAAVTLEAGGSYDLDVGVDPPPGEDAAFAWYSTVGEIDQYQSNPCELVTAEAEDGWLFVVIRDGRGGVAWRGLPVTVE